MKCPACQHELVQSDTSHSEEFGTVVVDICPDCGGIWLDRGELSRLDGNVWVDIDDYEFLPAGGNRPQIDCPKCHVATEPVAPSNFKELVLDRCPSCEGFWLERGELDRVRDVADSISSEMLQKAERLGPTLGEMKQQAGIAFWPFFLTSIN